MTAEFIKIMRIAQAALDYEKSHDILNELTELGITMFGDGGYEPSEELEEAKKDIARRSL